MKNYSICVGERFGRLIILEYTQKREHGCIVFKCLCNCGNICYVSSRNLRRDGTKSCGCLRNEILASGMTKLPKGRSMLNSLYANYKNHAIKRRLVWEISLDDFECLTQKPCFYCGVFPYQEIKQPWSNGSFIYNGIDRIDNLKGYIKDNCVTCCGTCNKAKNNMSITEFITWLENIMSHKKEWESLNESKNSRN